MTAIELVREANIKRNKSVLQQLGLDQKSKAKPKPKRQPRITTVEPNEFNGLRRSARLGKQDVELETLKDDIDAELERKQAAESKARASKRKPVRSEVRSEVREASLDKRSARNVHARLERIEAQLGKTIEPADGSQMKKAAMDALGEYPPKFSKMSGVQRFSNAIVLFVNIGGLDYANAFGRVGNALTLTWFAQSRHDSESPIVRDMLERAVSVLLFMREFNEAYVYSGTLSLHQVDLQTHPIRFVWILNSSEALLRSPAFLRITAEHIDKSLIINPDAL